MPSHRRRFPKSAWRQISRCMRLQPICTTFVPDAVLDANGSEVMVNETFGASLIGRHLPHDEVTVTPWEPDQEHDRNYPNLKIWNGRDHILVLQLKEDQPAKPPNFSDD